jgi:TetR/AcrR family transcriptional repressor of mexJK operon
MATQSHPTEFDDQSRSARKRRAIREAATSVFLQKGYLGTSMDEIAALAKVSKQTVYKHFADKERLFVEIVTSTVDQVSDPVHEEMLALRQSGDLASDLRDLARRMLEGVIQPRLLQLRRLVIGEASRFPELGRTFYERGPGRATTDLAAVFAEIGEREDLLFEDPYLAASQFNWLVMSAPINQAMLLGDDKPLARKEIQQLADAAVRTFLAAYRKP